MLAAKAKPKPVMSPRKRKAIAEKGIATKRAKKAREVREQSMTAFGAASLEASVEKELAFIHEALGKASSSSVFVLGSLLRDS
eukprot:2258673-Amphidinium_carterae.1